MSGSERCTMGKRVERTTRFVCPRCGDDRDGQVVSQDQWQPTSGVSTVLTGELESAVECCECGHRCDVGVLDIPTTEVLEEYVFQATRHAVAIVVKAGANLSDSIDPLVCTAALEAMSPTSRWYDQDALQRDVEALDEDAARACIGRLADELTPHGKERLLYRLARVANADGPTTDRQQRALRLTGHALRMQIIIRSE